VSRDGVREQLDRAGPDDEWLRHLHSSYVDRFLSDNQRIWATAAILVPVSLATFPAFFASSGRDVWKAIVFGAFSVAVMTFWHLIANRHRYFQQQAYTIATAIEAHVLGAETARAMRSAAKGDERKPRPGIQGARVGLLVGTLVLWILIVVLAGLGELPEAQS
jgi:hypothetical protein